MTGTITHENLIDCEEVLKRLHMSRPSLDRYIKRELIPAGVRLGRKLWWSEQSINNALTKIFDSPKKPEKRRRRSAAKAPAVS